MDGEPRESRHVGVRFVACLLAKAWHLAERDPERIDEVLGPSVDLLAWILKVPEAESCLPACTGCSARL